MSSPSPTIPAQVGGITNQQDFAPSILFAVLYGLTIIPFAYRLRNPNTRTWTISMGTLAFSIERVVIYSIRATESQTHNFGDTLSKGKIIYQQISFALGFLGFGGDVVNFTRAVLVNATLEDPKRGSPDEPRQRFWARRFADVYGLIWLVATITGIIGYGSYSGSPSDPEKADRVQRLRHFSSAAALILFLVLASCVQWARTRLRYVDGRAINTITAICLVAAIVPIYRLIVMHNRTTVLNVLPSSPPLYPPGSLTTTASKATFYIFHTLPEFSISLFIQAANLRSIFNTGPWGDWRGSDDKVGIPRLRQNGVEVEGVGVPSGRTMKTPKVFKAIGRLLGNGKKPADDPDATVAGSRVELTNQV